MCSMVQGRITGYKVQNGVTNNFSEFALYMIYEVAFCFNVPLRHALVHSQGQGWELRYDVI